MLFFQLKQSGPHELDPSHLILVNVTQDDATRYSCTVVDKKNQKDYIYYWLRVQPSKSTIPFIPLHTSGIQFIHRPAE